MPGTVLKIYVSEGKIYYCRPLFRPNSSNVAWVKEKASHNLRRMKGGWGKVENR